MGLMIARLLVCSWLYVIGGVGWHLFPEFMEQLWELIFAGNHSWALLSLY